MATRVNVDKLQAYTNFYDQWRRRFAAIMVRQGFNPASPDFDDILQELLTDFYAGDYLGLYDAEKASMNTWVHAFVLPRLRGKRDKLRTRQMREVYLSALVAEESDTELEDVLGAIDGDFVAVELAGVVADTAEALRGMLAHGKYSLRDLFLGVVEHVQQYGRVNREELARQYGVSVSTIGLLMRRLREAPPVQALKEALF